MSYVLLTENAFDELISRVEPKPGTSYVIEFGDTSLFEGLGEVDVAQVTKVEADADEPEAACSCFDDLLDCCT